MIYFKGRVTRVATRHMAPRQLTDLPDELVLQVMGSLGARDLMAVASTATRFRKLASAVPKRMRLSADSGMAPWRWIKSRAAATELIELSCVRASPTKCTPGARRDWGPAPWLARLERLERLATQFCVIPARVLESAPRGLVSLRLHQILGAGTFRTNAVAGLSKLRRLSLTFSYAAPSAWELVFIDRLPPALQKLELLRCPHLMVRDGVHGVREVKLHAYDGIVFFGSGGNVVADPDSDLTTALPRPPPNRITGCERLSLRSDVAVTGLDQVLPAGPGLRRLALSCPGVSAVPGVCDMVELEHLTVDFDEYDYSHADLAHVRDATIDARVKFVILDCQGPHVPGQRRVVRLGGRHVAWAGPPPGATWPL